MNNRDNQNVNNIRTMHSQTRNSMSGLTLLLTILGEIILFTFLSIPFATSCSLHGCPGIDTHTWYYFWPYALMVAGIINTWLIIRVIRMNKKTRHFILLFFAILITLIMIVFSIQWLMSS